MPFDNEVNADAISFLPLIFIIFAVVLLVLNHANIFKMTPVVTKEKRFIHTHNVVPENKHVMSGFIL